MWLKQCHKPPITRNGLYHLLMVKLAMAYVVSTTLLKWVDFHFMGGVGSIPFLRMVNSMKHNDISILLMVSILSNEQSVQPGWLLEFFFRPFFAGSPSSVSDDPK